MLSLSLILSLWMGHAREARQKAQRRTKLKVKREQAQRAQVCAATFLQGRANRRLPSKIDKKYDSFPAVRGTFADAYFSSGSSLLESGRKQKCKQG